MAWPVRDASAVAKPQGIGAMLRVLTRERLARLLLFVRGVDREVRK